MEKSKTMVTEDLETLFQELRGHYEYVSKLSNPLLKAIPGIGSYLLQNLQFQRNVAIYQYISKLPKEQQAQYLADFDITPDDLLNSKHYKPIPKRLDLSSKSNNKNKNKTICNIEDSSNNNSSKNNSNNDKNNNSNVNNLSKSVDDNNNNNNKSIVSTTSSIQSTGTKRKIELSLKSPYRSNNTSTNIVNNSLTSQNDSGLIALDNGDNISNSNNNNNNNNEINSHNSIVEKNFIQEDSSLDYYDIGDISPIKKKQSTLPAISNNRQSYSPPEPKSTSTPPPLTPPRSLSSSTSSLPPLVSSKTTPIKLPQPVATNNSNISSLPNPITKSISDSPMKSKIGKAVDKLMAQSNMKSEPSISSPSLSSSSISSSQSKITTESPSKKKPIDVNSLQKFIKKILKKQEYKFTKADDMFKGREEKPYGLTKEIDREDCIKVYRIGGGEFEYDITFGPTFTCSCPDWPKSGYYCKHMAYTMIYTLQFPRDHWAVRQKGFTKYDRYYLFYGGPQGLGKFLYSSTRFENFLSAQDEVDCEKINTLIIQGKYEEYREKMSEIYLNSNNNNSNLNSGSNSATTSQSTPPLDDNNMGNIITLD
ncbi:hypothetical protein CYY_006442 [Polysphondylium violaceum]|uniref:SWIM-type domain-containing protein n=1 Tax=Polysphondylium violaceum TaxID=133409 RepID=A0A8J4V351_9MYCE|nr:hypothetical protein CYY_006442 [Polysphondylium violaceum]